VDAETEAAAQRFLDALVAFDAVHMDASLGDRCALDRFTPAGEELLAAAKDLGRVLCV